MDALDSDCGFSGGAVDNPFGSPYSEGGRSELRTEPANGKERVSLQRSISLVTSLVEGLKV